MLGWIVGIGQSRGVRLGIRRLSSLGIPIIFVLFPGDVAEDVVKYIVARRLLGQDECLDEFAVRLGLVGDLANDLDENVFERFLRIDVEDSDLAVLDIQILDTLADGLEGLV